MPTRMIDTIFRPYAPSDAERSDRTAGDRARHRLKVRESIRENIADIIAEESIIGQNRDRVIKVPIRGIREYRFVYGDNAPGVGQGDGDSQQRPGRRQGARAQGAGRGQGRRPGRRRLLRDRRHARGAHRHHVRGPRAARPRAQGAAADRGLPRSSKRKGYRPVGIRIRLDKRRTARERVAAQDGRASSAADTGALDSPAAPESRRPRRFPFHDDDLVYRHMITDMRKESNAVVLCLMDTSGSMDTMKKYLARSFFFLLYQFICTKYRNVEIVFIAHHTEAKEVTEEEFFHKGESGGTFISSGYQKALEIIQARYHPSLWNVYAFHCSDGDNFDSDNPQALQRRAAS